MIVEGHPESSQHAENVLVLAPTGQDAPLTISILKQAGIAAEECRQMSELAIRALEGAGALLLADEVLNPGSVQALVGWLGRQPSWSDIPIIVVTRSGEMPQSVSDRLNSFGPSSNVTVLERPFRPMTLVTAVQVALRSRRRQYQIRDLLKERDNVLNSITDQRFVMDRKWRFLAINRAAEQNFFCQPAQELLGSSYLERPEKTIAAFKPHYERAFKENQPIHFEARSERDGRWLEVHAYPLPERLEIYMRDISDRKKSEEEHAHLAAVVASSDDAIISKDLNGIIQTWNRGAEALFGYTAAEAVGQPVTMLIPSDRLNEEERILSRLRRGESIEHYETIRRHKNSRLVHIALTVSPIRNPSGQVIGASKIARDITARKMAEEALHESEQRFRALADAVPSVVWSAAADGTVVWASKQWFDYTGLSPSQNSSEWMRQVLHPDDYERCLQEWNAAVASGSDFSIEVRNRRHDGQYRWFLSRAVAVKNETGEVQAWFGTTTDIDNQKGAEERIIRLNDTLLSVLEAIPDVVFVTNATGHIEFQNPAAKRFMKAAELDGLSPEIRAELDRVLTTGEHHLPTDFKNVHRFMIDNKERFFLSRTVSMLTPEREVFGAVVMVQDVTEFRLLDEVKTNLIGTVSHELKTPITGVLTAMMVLLEQAWGPLNKKQMELISIARDDSERLLKTLHSLLDLTRFESSVDAMRLENVPPEELVQAAVEEVHAMASNAKLSVKKEIEKGLKPVQVDKERIRHVLTNFLTNAIKYSPSGAEIIVRAQQRADGIRFSVVDEGPGVPAIYQSRIFDKFFRIPDRDSVQRGAGLGLSIAREFVRAHGGQIGVRSESGKGSEFYFHLPANGG